MNINKDGKLLKLVCMYVITRQLITQQFRVRLLVVIKPEVVKEALEIRAASARAKLRQSNRTDKRIELTMQLLHSC